MWYDISFFAQLNVSVYGFNYMPSKPGLSGSILTGFIGMIFDGTAFQYDYDLG